MLATACDLLVAGLGRDLLVPALSAVTDVAYLNRRGEVGAIQASDVIISLLETGDANVAGLGIGQSAAAKFKQRIRAGRSPVAAFLDIVSQLTGLPLGGLSERMAGKGSGR